MAKTPAAVVAVGEREVRVSSPDRVVYEATDRTPAITKLDVCRVLRVGRRTADAGARRTTDGDGAVAGRLAGGDAARHRPAGSGGGRLLPEAAAEGRSRLRRDRRDHLSQRPHRRRALSHRAGVAGLGCADGGADVPSVARTAAGGRSSRRAAARSGPATRDHLRGRAPGRRRRPGAAGGAGAARLREDERQPGRAHLRPDPADPHLRGRPARRHRVRPRAGASRRRRDHRVVEGGARASGSSWTSTRTTGTGPSPAPGVCGPARVHR